MQFLIEEVDGEQADQITMFCQFAYETLGIIDHPVLTFSPHLGTTSFGLYEPATASVSVATEGRHISDILRTFAHELVHHVQLTDSTDPMDRSIEELEYEANAVAGMLMRDYNKLHPEMFGLSSDVEAPNALGDSQGAVADDTTRPSQPIELAELSNKTLASYKRKANASVRWSKNAKPMFHWKWKNTTPGNPKTMQRHLHYVDPNAVPKREQSIKTAENKLRKRYTTEEMTAGAGDVAGIGIGPQGEPGVYPRKKKSPILAPIVRRKTLGSLGLPNTSLKSILRGKKTFKQLKEDMKPEQARKELANSLKKRTESEEKARKELLKRIK